QLLKCCLASPTINSIDWWSWEFCSMRWLLASSPCMALVTTARWPPGSRRHEVRGAGQPELGVPLHPGAAAAEIPGQTAGLPARSVQSRSLDPAALPHPAGPERPAADAEQHRLTQQLRPVAFDPEDAVSRLIDESFLSDGPPPPQSAQPSAPWNQRTANGGAGTSRLI
uniref:AGC-kinase C-terminal domain-containing protein n=1 Tax=Macrostomum lignano TaxID=282301 RepID=A0A1I8FGA9_9PLAT